MEPENGDIVDQHVKCMEVGLKIKISKYLGGIMNKAHHYLGCVTVGGAKIGASCVFPFIFMGVEYNGCTTIDGDSTPWCSTLVDDAGVHVRGIGAWGYCGPKCKLHTGRIVDKYLVIKIYKYLGEIITKI